MAEDYLRQSALAHLHLSGRGDPAAAVGGVVLSERPNRPMLDLRCDAADPEVARVIKDDCRLDLPLDPNTTSTARGTTVLWLGPDEWLIVGPMEKEAQRLRAGLAQHAAAVTEVGESRTVIGLSGPRARDVLMKGCTLDLHPRAFGSGHCAQTLLAKAGVLLHQAGDDPAYEIYVLRSFAEYLWLWLEDAAAAFGFAVKEP